MSDRASVEALDTRQLALTLQHLAAEVLPADAAVDGLANPSEGAEMLQAFLAAASDEIGRIEPGVSDNPQVLAQESVKLALGETDTHDLAEDLLADPPSDDQMGIEQIGQHIATLGFLVAFLQTKIAVHVSRAGGKTTFDFNLSKQAASNTVLAKMLSLIGGLLGGKSGP